MSAFQMESLRWSTLTPKRGADASTTDSVLELLEPAALLLDLALELDSGVSPEELDATEELDASEELDSIFWKTATYSASPLTLTARVFAL